LTASFALIGLHSLHSLRGRCRRTALALLSHVLDQQVGLQGEVFGVGAGLRVLREVEAAPGHDASEVAHAPRPVPALAQGLHPQPRQVLPLRLGLVRRLLRTRVGLAVVAAGHRALAVRGGFVAPPQVHLLVRVAARPRPLGLDFEQRPGAGVVQVPAGVAPAGQALLHAPAVDGLPLGLVALRVVRNAVIGALAGLQLGLHRLERAVVVAPDQPVHPRAVLEVVVDAPLLHEAAEEFVVALVVLHRVVALRVALDQALVGGERVLAQHGFDDVHDALVLEDFAVGGEGGQVQPGPQGELHQGALPGLAEGAGLGDEAADLAHPRAPLGRRSPGHAGQEAAVAFEFDAAGQLAADEAVQLQRTATTTATATGALQHQPVLEEGVDAFFAFELERLQPASPVQLGDRRAADRQPTPGGQWGHGCPPECCRCGSRGMLAIRNASSKRGLHWIDTRCKQASAPR
jgi:hypothetical protein